MPREDGQYRERLLRHNSHSEGNASAYSGQASKSRRVSRGRSTALIMERTRVLFVVRFWNTPSTNPQERRVSRK